MEKNLPLVKVSVAIITYNQVDLIGRAIDSVLVQITDFDYEILIGDDFSTDGTRDVIRQYARDYPGRIEPVLHQSHLGRGGLLNAMETLSHAKGSYLLILDGDDYWTDSNKLRKQVDFLDSHPDYVMCFHNAVMEYDDGSAPGLLNDETVFCTYTLDDLIGPEQVWFMATSSVMFRNVIAKYPPWFLNVPMGDIPRYILLARHGKIGYLPEPMSVYFVNRQGFSNTIKQFRPEVLRSHIAMYKALRKELPEQYERKISMHIGKYYRLLLETENQDSFFVRVKWALGYCIAARPAAAESRRMIRDRVLPSHVVKLYSFFAICLYRLRSSAFPFRRKLSSGVEDPDTVRKPLVREEEEVDATAALK